MPDGTGLKRFKNVFPERFFDVGDRRTACSDLCGRSGSGWHDSGRGGVFIPFLQRAFDQIVHDVCIQNLHVIFAVDRAGLVGSDGETHQGIFDLSYLSLIPNMCVWHQKSKWELSDMLKFCNFL